MIGCSDDIEGSKDDGFETQSNSSASHTSESIKSTQFIQHKSFKFEDVQADALLENSHKQSNHLGTKCSNFLSDGSENVNNLKQMNSIENDSSPNNNSNYELSLNIINHEYLDDDTIADNKTNIDKVGTRKNSKSLKQIKQGKPLTANAFDSVITEATIFRPVSTVSSPCHTPVIQKKIITQCSNSTSPNHSFAHRNTSSATANNFQVTSHPISYTGCDVLI